MDQGEIIRRLDTNPREFRVPCLSMRAMVPFVLNLCWPIGSGV
jgi:hypothetical protein